jgi:virginiamycin B lyase
MSWSAQSPAVLLIAASLAVVTACGAATTTTSTAPTTGSPSGAATGQPSSSPSPSAQTPTAALDTPTPSAIPSNSPIGFVPAPPQAAIAVYPITSNLADSVAHVRLGPDGAMWFTMGGMAPGALGRITTAGVITTWPLPWAGGDIHDFTFGDGFLWSIDVHTLNDSFIGKWTLTGALVQEFPIPATGYAITWGADGALWFSGSDVSGMDLSNSFIGRMTVPGVVTQYPMPDGSDLAGDMTIGPDGAIWFSELPGSSVGEVTTSGVITEYTVPGGANAGGPTSGNQTIVVGSDGALWSISTGEVTRVTTDGIVTVFPAAVPSSISTNADGDIWFLGNDPGTFNRAVLRMTTGGSTIADYPLDGTPGIEYGDPSGIITGADGMIWFGDGTAIARLDPSVPPTS